MELGYISQEFNGLPFMKNINKMDTSYSMQFRYRDKVFDKVSLQVSTCNERETFQCKSIETDTLMGLFATSQIE